MSPIVPREAVSDRGSHKVAEGTGAPPLWGKAEKVWAVEAGEQKLVWRPQSTFPVSKGATGKQDGDSSSGTVVTGQGGMT